MYELGGVRVQLVTQAQKYELDGVPVDLDTEEHTCTPVPSMILCGMR